MWRSNEMLMRMSWRRPIYLQRYSRFNNEKNYVNCHLQYLKVSDIAELGWLCFMWNILVKSSQVKSNFFWRGWIKEGRKENEYLKSNEEVQWSILSDLLLIKKLLNRILQTTIFEFPWNIRFFDLILTFIYIRTIECSHSVVLGGGAINI